MTPTEITSGKFLVMTRRIVSLLLLALLTIGFISSASAAVVCSAAIERAQIGPMILIGAFAALTLWMGATLLFGRIYCSTICPLGTLQDIAARLWRLTPGMAERHRYRYTTTQAPMQLSWTGVVAFLLIMSQPLLFVAFDPCSIFTRALRAIFGSLGPANAALIVKGTSLGVMATMVVFVPVIIVALFRGRIFCNTFCPVGGALSAVSRMSVMKIDINTDLCIHCNKCIDVCKAQCINPDDYAVDTPRCVVCFNCIKVCPNEAIRYTTHRHRLSTPMMMSTSNNMEITDTKNETISPTSRPDNDRGSR